MIACRIIDAVVACAGTQLVDALADEARALA